MSPKHTRPAARKGIPDRLNILLVGGGGREHALAWKLKRSKRLGSLWTTHPQNPGIRPLAQAVDIPFSSKVTFHVEKLCEREEINLVVVGPEAPLADGIVDALTNQKVAVFGPTAAGARLEADKAWAKQLMRAASIPTPEARIFDDPDAACAYIQSREAPLVVKAAGLAAGKGVFVPESADEALDAVDRIMRRGELGDAAKQILLEERLTGREVSVFALVDGRNIVVLDSCQDHKRLREGDVGPNTGGMGAFCPTDAIDAQTMDFVQRQIVIPTIDALRREGIEYRGILYVGLMLTHAGPKVLEYNVRFGDPECQCLMRRMRCDLPAVLYATATGQLADVEIETNPETVCCVVLASDGYPGAYETGVPIEGIQDAERIEGVTVFHAGTALGEGGQLETAGGRVLNVVATGETLDEARTRANTACELIQFDGKAYRRDIGMPATPAAQKRTLPLGPQGQR